jgi:hypothetical protein
MTSMIAARFAARIDALVVSPVRRTGQSGGW